MGPWTHGTIETKGDHNHHNRSYKICITKTAKIVTCNRQHIKLTPIIAEHYLHDQLHKHIKIDPLENILGQLKKQPSAYSIINNTDNEQNSSNTTHGHTTVYEEQDNHQERGEENGEQKIIVNKSPANRHSGNKENRHNSLIRARYERVIRTLDRLTY